jgi:hypothetical protein
MTNPPGVQYCLSHNHDQIVAFTREEFETALKIRCVQSQRRRSVV